MVTKKPDALAAYIARNIELANTCLSTDWPGKFNDFERGLLVSAVTHDYSHEVVERALAGDRDSLLQLLSAERVIAVMTSISATHRSAVKSKSIGDARQAKEMAAKPAEAALHAAIIAERGHVRPVGPCWTEANAILADVNKRLKALGFDPVKVDVVRRRLEKFPRSDSVQ